VTSHIVIHIPKSLFSYHTHLQRFFEGMIRKLDMNSHKTTPTTDDIPAIITKLHCEIVEFQEQFITNKEDENTLIELMDVANFAFLAYVACRLQGVKHANRKISHVTDE